MPKLHSYVVRLLRNPVIAWVVFGLLIIGAIASLAIGAGKLFDRHAATTAPVVLPSVEQVVTEDVAEPAETKPESDEYVVPSDLPRKILLPTINAEGFVQKVGVNKQNAIAVPSNVHFAGWFVNSVKPGERGLSILDGHVSGVYSDGIFKNLTKLQSGDRFSVEYGDGRTVEFEVVDTKTMPAADSAEYVQTYRPEIEAQINLITCGGAFDASTNSYEDRIVVVAKKM